MVNMTSNSITTIIDHWSGKVPGNQMKSINRKVAVSVKTNWKLRSVSLTFRSFLVCRHQSKYHLSHVSLAKTYLKKNLRINCPINIVQSFLSCYGLSWIKLTLLDIISALDYYNEIFSNFVVIETNYNNSCRQHGKWRNLRFIDYFRLSSPRESFMSL